MNIVILSRNPALYSTRRLVEAASNAGHEVQVIDTLQCVLAIRSGQPDILWQGRSLRDTDAIIPRIGASITGIGLAVIRQFEAMGVTTLVAAEALARSRDKLHCLQLLAHAGLGIPDSSYACDPESHRDMAALVGGAPLVLKLVSGAHGRGVVLADAPVVVDSVMDAFRALNADFLAQTFIAEAAGCDLRCFVVGNRVVAAMQRRAARGEFRSNLHKGGAAEPVTLTDAEHDAAIRAAAAVGLRVAGVDILRAARGPLVMEVNSSPGLEGIEHTTHENVAGLVIDELQRLHEVRH